MKRELLTGNGAAAWGARLARIDYLPAFPITPQTEIIETLGTWIENGEIPCRMVTMDSEHSMMTAAGAAATTGVRVFTATSSQGLLYGAEMLFALPGWRVPLVLVNVSRGIASPITLEPDHNDVLAVRDCGFLQIHCATCQEVLDSVLLAYRLAEDASVRLPVIVNLDGFYLSFTREPVLIPDPAEVDAFLPPFDAGSIRYRAGEPLSQGVAVLGAPAYSYFRYQAHLAAREALAVYERARAEFASQFGRDHGALEIYRCEDAETVFVMMGSFATKAKEAVDQLREAGFPVGLIRIRLLRPLPDEALRRALAGKRGVAVIDQNISMGMGGILHGEVTCALHGQRAAPKVVASFIGGLGGRDITPEEFYEIASVTAKAAAKGMSPPPRLLYTGEELRGVRKQQAIAGAGRSRGGAS
jgi:pyruvate ferredoxin oxidoreductase alpha subunit